MADFVTNTSNSGDGDWYEGAEFAAEAEGAQRQVEFDEPTAEVEETVTNWTDELEAVYQRNLAEQAIIAAMANNIQSPNASDDAPLATD